MIDEPWFDKTVIVPDKISTLELSKIWLHKACQELQAELAEVETEQEQEDLAE